MIANYEKDRAELEEGQPCPLCLSTHHPFRQHQVLHFFVDRAKVGNGYAYPVKRPFVYNNHRMLLNRQKDLKPRSNSWWAARSNNLSATRSPAKFDKILEHEDKIARVAPYLGTENYALARTEILHRKIEESEALMRERQLARNQLGNCLDCWRNRKPGSIRWRKSPGRTKTALKILEGRSEMQQQQLSAQLQEKFAQAGAQLDRLLQTILRWRQRLRYSNTL